MSASVRRLLGVTAAAVLFCALIVLYVALYLVEAPPSASASPTASGSQLYLATVPAAALDDPHATWVSYYAVDPSARHWRHATTYVLPAHRPVHVTIYTFDSQTGLRNPFIAQATGTVGGDIVLDGKAVQAIDPSTASHIFAVPQLGLSVPLLGVSNNARNTCAHAPCSLKNAHTTTSFTFRTPGPGLYRWQCFVPCAAGFIQGLGGPMQTVGYMDGYIKVV